MIMASGNLSRSSAAAASPLGSERTAIARRDSPSSSSCLDTEKPSPVFLPVTIATLPSTVISAGSGLGLVNCRQRHPRPEASNEANFSNWLDIESGS